MWRKRERERKREKYRDRQSDRLRGKRERGNTTNRI